MIQSVTALRKKPFVNFWQPLRSGFRGNRHHAPPISGGRTIWYHNTQKIPLLAIASALPPAQCFGTDAAVSTGSPILIVPYMWIGDFVRCHTVVRLLRARFPDRPIDVLTTRMVAPLLDYMPDVRKGIVFDLPRKRLAWSQQRDLGRTLRTEHYGDALIMPRTWKAALAPFLAGIPRRTGFLGELRLGLVNDLRGGEKALPRMVDRCAALALSNGAAPPTDLPPPQLVVPREEVAAWRDRIGLTADNRPVAVLAPGAVGPSKRWPFFGALTASLARAGFAVWVVGGPGEARARRRDRGPRPGNPRSHRAGFAQRHLGAERRRRSRSRTIPASCMSPRPWGRRPSGFSARPARGIGHRSIRWRALSKPQPAYRAGPATNRPAGSSTIAACATSPPSRSPPRCRGCLKNHQA